MSNTALAIRKCLLAILLFGAIQSTALCAKRVSLPAATPAGAIAYVEFSELAPVLERLRDSEYQRLAFLSPQYQSFQQSPEYQKALAVRQILELQLGMDLWTLGRGLLGGNLSVALYPRPPRKQPDVVVLLRVEDAKVLERLRERLAPFVTLLAGEQLDASDSIAGEPILTLKGPQGNGFVAGRDDWIAVCSTRDLLSQTIELLNGSQGKSLGDEPPFQEMTRDLGANHLVRLYVNTEMISQSAGGRFAPTKLDNPVSSLLIGGIVELAVASSYAGITLDVDQKQFVLTSGISGRSADLGENYGAFFSDPASAGTPAIPGVPGLIGGMTIFRDFADWYRRRNQLLQDDVLVGFDKFEAGIGNLLPGRDFAEDVLPLVGNRVTFVAAHQDYEHLDGTPGLKLPGFGLVVELAKPQEGADVLQLFFQTLSSILNIQAGQQGRQPWVMSSESYRDTQISFGRYLQKPSGDRLPLVFNFMPAAARVEDKFIISSSLGLCRKLVDALSDTPTQSDRANKNFNIEFHFDPFVEILQANQEVFHARSVQQGRELKQAQSEFKTITGLLRVWEDVAFSTSVKAEAFQVQLRGSWK